MEQTKPFTITISRQLGSGGEYIGKRLAERLKFYYADREIIALVADQLSIVEERLDLRDERVMSMWHTFLRYSSFGSEVHSQGKTYDPTDYELFRTQSEVIEHIANEQSAVIIGRCGFHILRDYPNHISLYIHADMNYRIDKVRREENVTEDDARKMIVSCDKERTQYCRKFTGKVWSDISNYDITLDAGRMGAENCVDLIFYYMRTRYMNL